MPGSLLSDLKHLEAVGIDYLCPVYLSHPFIASPIIVYMAVQMIFGVIALYEAVKAPETPVAKVFFIMYAQGWRMGNQDIHIFFFE